MRNWQYNEETDTWFFGHENEGGGVFLDKPMTKTKKEQVWTGNAVFGCEIHNIGDCKHRGQAMMKVESELEKMKREC